MNAESDKVFQEIREKMRHFEGVNPLWCCQPLKSRLYPEQIENPECYKSAGAIKNASAAHRRG